MNIEGWPDIGTLIFGLTHNPGERTREFIVKILERRHYGPTSVRPTEQTLGPQVYTDAGKSTFQTLPFRFGRRKLPSEREMMMKTPDESNDDGGVVRSAVSVARIGSDFDVVHLCLGLLLSSDTVLSGVMKSTPRAIRDVYFGEDGQVFRTRLGGYLLGGINFARLPGAVIVASERLCLREAYASAGLEPRGLGL